MSFGFHIINHVPDSICCSKLLNSIFTLSFHFSTSLPSVPLHSFNLENRFTLISSSHSLDSIALCPFLFIYLFPSTYLLKFSIQLNLFLIPSPVFTFFHSCPYSLSILVTPCHIFLYIISFVCLYIKNQLQNIEDTFKRVRHN